jgi:hypothetical protein
MAGESPFEAELERIEIDLLKEILASTQRIEHQLQGEKRTMATLSEKLDQVLAAQAADAASDAIVAAKLDALKAEVDALPPGSIPQSVMDQITDIQKQVAESVTQPPEPNP